MKEQNRQPNFAEVLSQKKQALQEAVDAYGGVMVGHPSASDIEALANLQARHAMGERLSRRDVRKAEALAAKFQGSFC